MRSLPDMSLWTGRDDSAVEGPHALRWHQCIKPWSDDAPPGITLLGFACDEGVRRNHGRPGAAKGPAAIRRSLAGLAWSKQLSLFDGGDTAGRDLDQAQSTHAEAVRFLLGKRQKVIVLGGGHETAWGTFQGLTQAFPEATIGIINLDAHFDLRAFPPASSGTPFRQMAEWCRSLAKPFRYLCLGIAEPANTNALFQTAQHLEVRWKFDHELAVGTLEPARALIQDFVGGVDLVYLSVDLDVLPGSVMPAVSAPAARGVPLEVIEALMQGVAGTGKLAAADVVEFNPTYDPEGLAVRVAARLVWQLARHWQGSPVVRQA